MNQPLKWRDLDFFQRLLIAAAAATVLFLTAPYFGIGSPGGGPAAGRGAARQPPKAAVPAPGRRAAPAPAQESKTGAGTGTESKKFEDIEELLK